MEFLNPISGLLSYINAGYEPPLIINRGEIKTTLNPTGSALGVTTEFDFKIQQTQLDPGDTLLIFSDGVSAAKNPTEQSFGRNRLLRIIENTNLSAAALLSLIEKNLQAYTAETTQQDDITMFAVSHLS